MSLAPGDKSVSLLDLARRADAGPQRARGRSDCKNPECNNGLTPGVSASGGGVKGAPLFGAGGVGAKKLMRWGWVQCLACNPSEDHRKAGARYVPLNLNDTQIAQRAQLANTKAAYQPPMKEHLGKLAGGRTGAAPNNVPSVDAGKLSELMEQNKQLNARLDELLKQNVAMTETLGRMSMQVAALLEDNAKLRMAQPAATTQVTV